MQTDGRSTLLRASALTLLSLAVFAAAFGITLMVLPDFADRGLDNLCRWDCGWYRSIAGNGYQVDPSPNDLQANYAFYPVFPGAARLVMLATGLGFVHAALLLNAVSTLVFGWLALASRDVLLLRSDRDAAVFLLAFLLAPWSLYNRVPYTEMSFNLAMLATYVAWRREQYVAAALCGLVLTATRATGVLLPVMLLVELLLQERWRAFDLLRAPDARFRALAVMPFGGLIFFIYLGLHVGDPLASFHIMSGWNHGFRDPIENLVGGLLTLNPEGVFPAVAFVVSTLLLVLGWRRGRVPFVLAMACVLTACSAIVSGLISLPRYILALFPVYLMVPALPPKLQWALLGGFAILQGVFIYYWVLRTPALI